MREIKFRGLTAKNELAYGLPYDDAPNSTAYYKSYSQRMCWVMNGGYSSAPIKNGTLCQFTGLKDKNGKEIYEDDVIKFGAQYGSISVVKHIGASYQVKDKFGDWYDLYDVTESTNIEVIGNIHDNPGLLEVKG